MGRPRCSNAGSHCSARLAPSEAIVDTFLDKAKRIATSLQLALFYRPEHDRLRVAP
jgi:hypothetical protein